MTYNLLSIPKQDLPESWYSVADFLVDLHTDFLPGSVQVNFPTYALQGLFYQHILPELVIYLFGASHSNGGAFLV